MTGCALAHNQLPEGSVVENTVNVIVIDLAGDIHFHLSINVQWLCGRAFVIQDPDAGIQRNS